jgi:hypothetical protein
MIDRLYRVWVTHTEGAWVYARAIDAHDARARAVEMARSVQWCRSPVNAEGIDHWSTDMVEMIEDCAGERVR